MLRIFFVRNSQILVMNQSVCLTMLEKVARDKHSIILIQTVNYRQKSFIKLPPGPNVIKLFITVIYEYS
jgi:hypothetical protein